MRAAAGGSRGGPAGVPARLILAGVPARLHLAGVPARGRLAAAVVMAAGLIAAGGMAAWADDDPASPAAVKRLLDGARDDLGAGRLSAARSKLVEAAAGLDAIFGEEKPPAAARMLLGRAGALCDELELQGGDSAGIDLPEPPKAADRKPSDRKGADAAPKGRGRSGPAARRPGGGTAAEGTVSFATQIAPLLVRHCGGCHVGGRRGDFQFTSYASLLDSGMVQKGAGADSRLVEVIRTGDMPRGGGKVSAEELEVLRTWIDEGAACDTDPAAALPGAPAPAAAPAPVKVAAVKLEPGEVSFAFQVAPVLLEHCGGCHDAMQPDGNLSMVSLESLLRGGANGAPAVAGEGAASLLVRKLLGVDIDGQRMPLGKKPLPDDVVDTIRTWIDQGMKLDLLSGDTPLATVAAAGRARSLSHDDLRAARFEAADDVWRRSIADEAPTEVVRGDLRVLGNLGPERLGRLADTAAAALGDVAEAVASSDAPPIKGGVVLLAFAKPYDYSAFWENILGDERPKGLVHSAGVWGDVVYAALVAPETDSPAALADARASLVEELGAAAFLARGAPGWFATAAGRAIAVRAVPKSALAKAARSDAAQRLERLRRPESIVAGEASAADTAAVGGAFLAAASGGGSRFKAIASRLDEGMGFDEAFAAVYQAAPAAAFDAWRAKEWKRGGSPGR